MTKVFLRPRPLAASEEGDALVEYVQERDGVSVHTAASVQHFQPLAGVLSPANSAAYAETLAPLMADVMAGGTACCFAYGHTNSGKTHTIFGYDHERGLYQHAVNDLFAHAPATGQLVQVRFFELYNGKVFDLLDDRRPGFVREDRDGTIHVRSETTMGPNGEVLTQSLHAQYCDSAAGVEQVVRSGAGARAQGTSELHGQSSRSHAILELEIVTRRLAEARQALVHAKSRVVPAGKARDDLYIAIQSKLYKQGDDGKYVCIGVASAEDTERLAGLEAQLRVAEEEVRLAEAKVAEAMGETSSAIGGMLVLVDLAGAEYTGEGLARSSKELREAREINGSLLALKECIRTQAEGGRHTPFRNSKLTMLLRSHLAPANADRTVMIANVSSSAAMAAKAINTIKYAVLVADAFSK